MKAMRVHLVLGLICLGCVYFPASAQDEITPQPSFSTQNYWNAGDEPDAASPPTSASSVSGLYPQSDVTYTGAVPYYDEPKYDDPMGGDSPIQQVEHQFQDPQFPSSHFLNSSLQPAPIPNLPGDAVAPVETVPAIPLPGSRPGPPQAAPGDSHPNPLNLQPPNIVDPALEKPGLVEGAVIAEPVKPPPPPPNIWSGNFELGINGSSGNSETFNIHFGMHAKRKTKWSIFTADLNYFRNYSNSMEVAHRLFTETRYERLFEEGSKWSWFVHGTAEYDQFRAFDVRLNSDTGLSYLWFDTELSLFKTRFGASASHEIGGMDDEIVPELIFGADFEHQLTKRQRLRMTFDYFPDITDPGDFRINGKFDWEILLDEEWDLSLKFGVVDRFDSTPGDAKENDISYTTVLLWSY